jgi:acetyl-CoA C-acetyltransferase
MMAHRPSIGDYEEYKMSQPVPILVGISHVEQRFEDFSSAKEPIELMIDAVKAAAADAGNSDLLNASSVRVIKGIWDYQNPAKAVAQSIGCPNAQTAISPFGGNFVQSVLNLSALDIQNGIHDIIILTGAECGNTQAKAAKAGHDLGWADLPGSPDLRIGEEKDMRHDAERAIRLGRPIQVYPIMETALRHELGLGVDEHIRHISELWAGFSQVAANNPNAWIREAKSAEEIRTISAVNRPVSFPYPKFLNSNSAVDQAAALILCSEEKAASLGIAREKWIYPWSGSDAQDHYHFSTRDNFYTSPAIRLAGKKCLEMSDMTAADIDLVDVYSCFPVAVQVASRELGLDTSKPLTVTGGLTWAGGPMNNYVMHSIVRMAQLLREKPSQKGMITANGGYITKHAFGIYSTDKPEKPFQHANLQDQVDALPKREVLMEYTGDATVEGYSVMYGAKGLEKAFVAGRLADGTRSWGTALDADVLKSMTIEEFVGRPVKLENNVATF